MSTKMSNIISQIPTIEDVDNLNELVEQVNELIMTNNKNGLKKLLVAGLPHTPEASLLKEFFCVALETCIFRNNVDICTFLLKYLNDYHSQYIDVTCCDKAPPWEINRQSLIIQCAERSIDDDGYKIEPMLSVLIEHGAKVNVQDTMKETVLHKLTPYAYFFGIVCKLIDEHEADVSILSMYQRTALHAACYIDPDVKQDASIVHKICSNNSKLVQVKDVNGNTALHLAAFTGFWSAISDLICNAGEGFNLLGKNIHGHTAEDVARRQGLKEASNERMQVLSEEGKVYMNNPMRVANMLEAIRLKLTDIETATIFKRVCGVELTPLILDNVPKDVKIPQSYDVLDPIMLMDSTRVFSEVIGDIISPWGPDMDSIKNEAEQL
jgi:hypothetical protein